MADTYKDSTSTGSGDLYKMIEYAPQVILGLFYIIHGAGSLFMPPSSVAMMNYVGFSVTTGRTLVFLIGCMDIAAGVWILTIHQSELMDKLVLVYAALWPVAPNILAAVLGFEFEAEFITTTLLAIAVWYFQIQKHTFSDLLTKINSYGKSEEQLAD